MGFFRKQNRYDDSDIDYSNEYVSENKIISPDILSPVSISFADLFASIFISLICIVFAFAFSSNSLHPSAWLDCAIASGFRHPTTICPGFWRLGASLLYYVAGVSVGNVIISVMGKIALGVIAGMSYLVFRKILAVLVRRFPPVGLWNKFLARILSAISALAFGCSDPMWQVCQAFTTNTFLTLLFISTILLWLGFLQKGNLSAAYGTMFVTGFFAAETPIGLLLLPLYWICYHLLNKRGYLKQVELGNLFVLQNAKWYLTISGGAGFLLGVALNIVSFIKLGGVQANELYVGNLPFLYMSHLWNMVVNSASITCWIIAVGVILLPVILSFQLILSATDPGFFLKYQTGFVFFFFSCLSYVQLAFLRPLWFWVWTQDLGKAPNPFALVVFIFMASLTLLISMSVLCIDAFCRNKYRLAAEIDPELVQGVSATVTRKQHSYRLILFSCFCGIFVLGILGGRIQPVSLQAISIMQRYVKEIVNETGDAKWLFTDGAFDCAIELEAAKQNKRINCISLIPGKAVRNKYECKQCLPDYEDQLAVDVNGSTLLRSWVKDKKARLQEAAFMLGFEMWRIRGEKYPIVAGVLGKVDPVWNENDYCDYVKNGEALITDILALYSKYRSIHSLDPSIKDLFLIMQWRLSRLTSIRSALCDAEGKAEESIALTELYGKLDKCNEALAKILEKMNSYRETSTRQMSPREGLQYSMVRRNFILARQYATIILNANPDDVDANFATAMGYYQEGAWARSEEYFKRAIAKRPNEPTLWNNLAMVYLKTKRLQDALSKAQKALSLKPDSAEIKDTVRQIESAIANLEKEESEKKDDSGKPDNKEDNKKVGVK